MQIRRYLIKYANLHTFPEQKTEYWIKPGSKFLFYFVDILKGKCFYRGYFGYLFYNSINQKMHSTDTQGEKQQNIIQIRRIIYTVNKHLCKNLNIDR